MDFNNELVIHGFLAARYYFVTVVEVLRASIPEAITSEKDSKAFSAQSSLVTDVQSTAVIVCTNLSELNRRFVKMALVFLEPRM